MSAFAMFKIDYLITKSENVLLIIMTKYLKNIIKLKEKNYVNLRRCQGIYC